MTEFELDHVFICTDIDALEADRLITFGLTEGTSNIHPGQGTANRRFFFHNAMLELLWIHSPEEAQSTVTRPTRLWERWAQRHSDATTPFGICLRPRYDTPQALPFAAWPYTPAYLPAPWVIDVGENSTILAEPMLFHVAFGHRPDQTESRDRLEHAIGFREITSLRIQHPQATPPSAALRTVEEMGIVTVRAGVPALMEIGFDGETQGRLMDFRPQLPLVLYW